MQRAIRRLFSWTDDSTESQKCHYIIQFSIVEDSYTVDESKPFYLWRNVTLKIHPPENGESCIEKRFSKP